MFLTGEQRNQIFKIRKALDNFVSKISDVPSEINENSAAIRLWKPGIYSIGDVRLYKEIPYKCIQAHDSSLNEEWAPKEIPSLWMQYHGTSVETARPWITPTMAEDIYKIGEYMVWTDNNIYECILDTNFSPDDFPQAWNKCDI